MTRITSQRRERATRYSLLPLSLCLLSLSLSRVEGTYRFTFMYSTPPRATLFRPLPPSPRPVVGHPYTHDICGALYIYSAVAASAQQDRGEAASLRWYTELRVTLPRLRFRFCRFKEREREGRQKKVDAKREK